MMPGAWPKGPVTDGVCGLLEACDPSRREGWPLQRIQVACQGTSRRQKILQDHAKAEFH